MNETASQLLIVMEMLKTKLGPDGCKKQIIATTDPKQGTLQKIADEVAGMRQTERGNRSDDKLSESAMEDRKRQGYF